MEEAQQVLTEYNHHTGTPANMFCSLKQRCVILVHWCIVGGFLHLLVDYNLDLPVLKPLKGYFKHHDLDLEPMFHLQMDHEKTVEVVLTLSAATLMSLVIEWLAGLTCTYYLVLIVADIVFSIWLGKEVFPPHCIPSVSCALASREWVLQVGSCILACMLLEIVAINLAPATSAMDGGPAIPVGPEPAVPVPLESFDLAVPLLLDQSMRSRQGMESQDLAAPAVDEAGFQPATIVSIAESSQ